MMPVVPAPDRFATGFRLDIARLDLRLPIIDSLRRIQEEFLRRLYWETYVTGST